jgi:hypothetical protein
MKKGRKEERRERKKKETYSTRRIRPLNRNPIPSNQTKHLRIKLAQLLKYNCKLQMWWHVHLIEFDTIASVDDLDHCRVRIERRSIFRIQRRGRFRWLRWKNSHRFGHQSRTVRNVQSFLRWRKGNYRMSMAFAVIASLMCWCANVLGVTVLKFLRADMAILWKKNPTTHEIPVTIPSGEWE